LNSFGIVVLSIRRDLPADDIFAHCDFNCPLIVPSIRFHSEFAFRDARAQVHSAEWTNSCSGGTGIFIGMHISIIMGIIERLNIRFFFLVDLYKNTVTGFRYK
jgi:hypothetical protein